MLGVTSDSQIFRVVRKMLEIELITQECFDILNKYVFCGINTLKIADLRAIDISKRIKKLDVPTARALGQFVRKLPGVTGDTFINPLQYLIPDKSEPRNNIVRFEDVFTAMGVALEKSNLYRKNKRKGNVFKASVTYSGVYRTIVLCAALGLRVHEAVNLKYEDVYFDTRQIHIKETKNSKNGRIIHFQSILPQFHSQLFEFLENKKSSSFIIKTGGIIEGRYKLIQKRFATMNEPKKYTDFQLRDLRRLSGQTLVSIGANVNQIANHLGHKNTQTTHKHYIKQVEDRPIANNFYN